MAYVPRIVKRRLGEILIDAGLLRESEIKEALAAQKASNRPLGEILVELGKIKEEDIAYALARQYGLPYINASRYTVQGDFVDRVPVSLMEKHQFVVLDRIGEFLIIATAGVIDADLLTEIEKKTGCQLFVYISTVSQVRDVLRKVYRSG